MFVLIFSMGNPLLGFYLCFFKEGGRGSYLANPINCTWVCLVGDFGSCPMGHISCQKR